VVIVNAFVAELLRSTKLQQLLQQRSLALGALAKQLGKFGDKHPGVVAALGCLLRGPVGRVRVGGGVAAPPATLFSAAGCSERGGGLGFHGGKGQIRWGHAEALPLAPLPSTAALAAAPARLNTHFNSVLGKPAMAVSMGKVTLCSVSSGE